MELKGFDHAVWDLTSVLGFIPSTAEPQLSSHSLRVDSTGPSECSLSVTHTAPQFATEC